MQLLAPRPERAVARLAVTGRPLSHNAAFAARVGSLDLSERHSLGEAIGRRRLSSFARLRPDGQGVALVGTFVPHALLARYDDETRAHRTQSEHEALCIASSPESYTGRMHEVLSVYGLSPRQCDVVAALVATGSVRRAARVACVDYEGARTAVAAARDKMGMANIVHLIDQVAHLALGLQPPVDAEDSDIAHAIGLTARQYAIAASFAVQPTREAVAAALGLSETVVLRQLKDIYLILGVNSAGEMARVLREVRTASLYLAPGASEGPLGPPTRYVQRADGTRIGYSDYGPADAPPVFILHSTICARHPPTRLVAALHDAGYRTLAIDRPGFGDSDASPGPDPNAAAAADFASVCADLGIGRCDIVARGSGQAAVTLGSRHPGLVRRAVLVNPTPAAGHTNSDRGPLGAVKRRLLAKPAIAALMVRMLAAYASPVRIRDGMRRSFADSPPDLAAVDDATFVADYLRANMGFAEGRIAGYVAEQQGWATAAPTPPLPGMTGWRMIFGGHFVLHDPVEAEAWWREILPDTPVTLVPEAGQLLAYTHPDKVTRALKE